MNKNKVILLVVVGLMLGTIIGGLTFRWLFFSHPKLVCSADCQNSVTPDRRFFADELLLVGETDSSTPFLLYLDLNRKKISGSYEHYYFADYIYNNQPRQLYTDFTSDLPDISPKNFLTSFSQKIANDLSARESYTFSFKNQDLNVQATLPDFHGDFIVKNTLEYTKYVSEGQAEVVVNGKTYTMHAFLSKIYTPYYDKYVFFKGYDDLQSLAQFMVLWDEDGNFYVLDNSEVEKELPEYKSHTWVLYKNSKDQSTRKAFSANVNYQHTNFMPEKWSIYIPDLEITLDLAPKILITNQRNKGLLEGTATSAFGTKNIKGYFSFTKYGK